MLTSWPSCLILYPCALLNMPCPASLHLSVTCCALSSCALPDCGLLHPLSSALSGFPCLAVTCYALTKNCSSLPALSLECPALRCHACSALHYPACACPALLCTTLRVPALIRPALLCPVLLYLVEGCARPCLALSQLAHSNVGGLSRHSMLCPGKACYALPYLSCPVLA